MKRTKWEETRVVGGKTFLVKKVERLEYSGDWADDGYDVCVEEKSCNMVGWPTNNDLQSFLDKQTSSV